MSAEEESGPVFVRESMRIRREIIEPILKEAASSFIRSCASAGPPGKADVLDVPGPGICLALWQGSERQQLAFLFSVTPRKVMVSRTDVRDTRSPVGEPLSLSDVKTSLVQSYVDDFLAAIVP